MTGPSCQEAEEEVADPALRRVEQTSPELLAAIERCPLERDGGEALELLGGLDTNSLVCARGRYLIKARRISAFRGRLLQRALSDIHARLAPAGLAPRLLHVQSAGGVLLTVHDRLQAVGSATPSEVGRALGEAHRRLAGLPVRSSFPWSGFYGEYQEFRHLVPLVADAELARQAALLLPHTRERAHREPVHYIHRDLSPENVLRTREGVVLIDWEMAHGGHREDDVAMTLLCQATPGGASRREDARELLHGYRSVLGSDWARLAHPLLRSALALAGLRQAVAGWFADEGDTSAPYWGNIRERLRTACRLLEIGG